MPAFYVYAMDDRDDAAEPCRVAHTTASAADAWATRDQMAAAETDRHITFTTDAPEIVI